MIESKDFQSYIEEEQKDELLDFIFSHCSPKSIIIDRVAEKSTEGKIKGNIKAVNQKQVWIFGVNREITIIFRILMVRQEKLHEIVIFGLSLL